MILLKNLYEKHEVLHNIQQITFNLLKVMVEYYTLESKHDKGNLLLNTIRLSLVNEI